MSRLLLTASLCIIQLLPAWASAEAPKEKIKGPITVTSETLTADNKEHTALFERNVIAKTMDMTIHADWMLVYYKEQGGDVTKIEAKGNVNVYREAKVITSKEATYFADEEKVVFTGSPAPLTVKMSSPAPRSLISQKMTGLLSKTARLFSRISRTDNAHT